MELHIEELSDHENEDSLPDISWSPMSSPFPVLPVVEEVHESEHSKFINQLRERFFADVYGSSDSKKSPANHRLKRSMTERGPRKLPRDYSFDSGLSSPGSNLSYDEVFQTAPRMTRHMSMDGMQMDRHKIYRSVRDLEEEAQKVQHLVEDMTSTQTMRRRRKMSAGLSTYARKLRAKHSLSSYSPIAPREPECAQRFDEIIARLRGWEPSADDAHICAEEECDSACEMKNSAIDKTSDGEQNGYEHFEPAQTALDTDDVFTVEEEGFTRKKGSELETGSKDQTNLVDGLEDCESSHTERSSTDSDDKNTLTDSSTNSTDSPQDLTNCILDNEDTAEDVTKINQAEICNSEDAAKSDESVLQKDKTHENLLEKNVASTIPDNCLVDKTMVKADSLNNIVGYESEEIMSWSAEVMEEIVTISLASPQNHASEEPVEPARVSPTDCAPDRICPSMAEETLTDKPDIKSLLRSISFQRASLVTNSTCRLRRTDSDNDVWIERPKLNQANNTSNISLATTSKKSSRWKTFSRMFSFRSSRRPVLKS